MKADKTVLWLPRLAILSLGLMLISTSGLASVLEGAPYQVVTTNAPDDSTQTLTLNNTIQTVDEGNLTIQATVIPDVSNPNADWIDFNFQVVPGSVLARNPDGWWEIDVNNVQLSQPGFLTGVTAYWTINGVSAPNIKPITGLPAASTNPINSTLGDAYSLTDPESSPITLITNLDAHIAPYATQLASGGMDPNAVNGFHLDALVTNATSAVPEPSTFALSSLAVLVLLFAARKRQRAAH